MRHFPRGLALELGDLGHFGSLSLKIVRNRSIDCVVIRFGVLVVRILAAIFRKDKFLVQSKRFSAVFAALVPQISISVVVHQAEPLQHSIAAQMNAV